MKSMHTTRKKGEWKLKTSQNVARILSCDLGTEFATECYSLLEDLPQLRYLAPKFSLEIERPSQQTGDASIFQSIFRLIIN